MQIQFNKQALHVCEVGVGDEFTAKSRQFWNSEAHRVELFEPNPFLYASLARRASPYRNVRVYNVAIADENRVGHLVSAGLLSHLEGVPSPIESIFCGKLAPMLSAFKVPVNLMTIDRFDPGTIDLLILGMEGAESMVFPHLVSRPSAIILNNHFANDYRYTFPRFEEIQRWCFDNRYEILQGVPDLMFVSVASLAQGIISSSS